MGGRCANSSFRGSGINLAHEKQKLEEPVTDKKFYRKWRTKAAKLARFYVGIPKFRVWWLVIILIRVT
jgi:hypothetical protein